MVADTRAKRESVFRNAIITMAGSNTEITCRVRNVSETGAGVSHDNVLSTGMTLRIAIGKAPAVDATVVWATGKTAGITFDGAIRQGTQVETVPEPKAGWLAGINDAYQR
jgi:hypothetical protein